MAAAVYNLASLTNQYLIVSISTRPSKKDNLLHATLMPISTWIMAFEAAGLQLVEKNAFPGATTRFSFGQSDELRMINRWASTDLFADSDAGEPVYVIFKKTKQTGALSAILSAVDLVVDVAYRRKKRSQFTVADDRRINFIMHYHQEWALIRPLLDVIPRSQCRFLIRQDYILPDVLRAIRSFLARTGVEMIEFSNISELPWHELKGQVVLSAAESSLGQGHLLGYEVVSVARLHGCQTFLLQHGVWPRSFDNRVLTFASEKVLTWGKEDERRLNDRTHRMFATTVPWGAFPKHQALSIGSPKFSDQLIGPFPGLSTKFGHDASRYKRTILIGTKDLRGRWGVDSLNAQFMQQLEELISKNEDIFFVIRPHPSDSSESFSSIKTSNVRIFDELVGILSDIPLNRVMPYVDLVASSPSSLVIDAAVSKKPIVVYGTGQPIEFEGMETVPFEKLQSSIYSPNAIDRGNELSDHLRALYAEAVDDSFYNKFSSLLTTPSAVPMDTFIAASATLSLQAVESDRLRVKTELTATAEAAGFREQLSAMASEMRRNAFDAARQLEQLSHDLRTANAKASQLAIENDAMRASTSWRLTQPLRHIMRALRRLMSRS